MQTIPFWGLRVAKVVDLWSYLEVYRVFIPSAWVFLWLLSRYYREHCFFDLVLVAPVHLRPPEYVPY